MKRFFDRPQAAESHVGKGSALVDWTVLLTGILMLAFSVAPAVTAKADQISGGALDRAMPEEDWHPS